MVCRKCPGPERFRISRFSFRRLLEKRGKFSSSSPAPSGSLWQNIRTSSRRVPHPAFLKREAIDLGVVVRRVFRGRMFPLVLRFLPRGRFSLLKEHIAHVAVFFIVSGVVLTNYITQAADQGSLLFRLFGDAQIEEGPYDPSRGSVKAASANRDVDTAVPFVQAALAGGVSQDDLEFKLSNTLDGNALIASNGPETSTTPEEQQKHSREFAYRVQEGDTPSSIAAKFGVSTNTILWANGIHDGDVIRTGDILIILPVTGVLHTVRQGETLASIAKKYDAKASDVLSQNDLKSADSIHSGEKIIIPDGYIAPTPTPKSELAENEESSNDNTDNGEPTPLEPTSPLETPQPSEEKPSAPPGTKFAWPIQPVHGVSQYFGWRHTGIDIPNRNLPPVHAAKAGTVAFSGWLGGYGHLIIIDHGNGYRTYYAHLSQDFVKVGQRVAQGETIGRVGTTGRSTGPHLHFEIRKNGIPTNPLNQM